MFERDDAYVHFLQKQKGRVFHVKPYIGNSGDALIRLGTELLLEELGLATHRDPRQADVILWPGGNPSMWPGNGWLETLGRFQGKEFIVGPATFQYHPDNNWAAALNQSPMRILSVFARDQKSLKNLREAGLRQDIPTGIGHDPALHLRDSAWVRARQVALSDEYVLGCFRMDHEAAVSGGKRKWIKLLPELISSRVRRNLAKRELGRRLVPLEAVRAQDVPLRLNDVSAIDFESFVEWVVRAKEVHTDRLHCLLLAVLLGKKAFAYPTAYGKLEAVYEQSLKPWAKVTFVKL